MNQGSHEKLVNEINDCEYLYLRFIGEPADNRLRLVIEEAGLGVTKTIEIDGLELGAGREIASDENSRAFELIWRNYVAYVVVNESYAGPEGEKYTGCLYREYAESHFLRYVSAATIASVDYPGTLRHFEVVCLNHVIEVVSTSSPAIQAFSMREAP